MVLKAGTKVKVLGPTLGDYHGFKAGQIVTATGELFPDLPSWQNFRDAYGDTQFMMDKHFEVVKEVEVVKPAKAVEAPVKEVETSVKVKAVYAILKEDGDIVATTADRDFARELKAAMGGKRKGISIFQYGSAKEIR